MTQELAEMSTASRSRLSRPRATYLLGEYHSTLIYAAPERRAIEEMVEVLPSVARDGRLVADPDVLAETEIIFSGWGGPKLDAELLEQLPKLKLVLYGAGSIRPLVTDDFWARGIPICSAWAANGVPVAEFTLASILLSMKRVFSFARDLRRDQTWPAERHNMAGNYGSTVGLVSLGMIGRQVRELLRPFEHRVVAFDPFFPPESAGELDIELLSLEEVFAQSDVVSLHTPWLPETEKMITGELLASMKPNATFINTSRGAVIDEPAMIEVLEKRPDLIAVLDVTYPEPPPKESPLYTLPNVVLTPHVAGSQGGECRRMARYMIQECERFLRGEPLRWSVSREQFQHMA